MTNAVQVFQVVPPKLEASHPEFHTADLAHVSCEKSVERKKELIFAFTTD